MSQCEIWKLPPVHVRIHTTNSDGVQINRNNQLESAKKVVESLIHTVLFNRSLGHCAPKENRSVFVYELTETNIVEELNWTENGDRGVSELINDYLSGIFGAVQERLQSLFGKEANTPGLEKGQKKVYRIHIFEVGLRLYETLPLENQSASQRGFLQGFLGAQRTTEEGLVAWEQWIFPIDIEIHQSPRTKEVREKYSVQGLRKVQFEIIKALNTHRDHIPPVLSGEGLTFPFDIITLDTTHTVSCDILGYQGVSNVEQVLATFSIKGESDRNSALKALDMGIDVVKKVLSSTQPPSVLQH
jgi:hypothetical protein